MIGLLPDLPPNVAGFRASGEVTKDDFEKVIFPEGVYYNLENEAFRTEKVNRVFQLIPQLNCISGDDKKRQEAIESLLSSHVGRTGFEPATPWSQTTYSTGLNYLPKYVNYLL